MRIRSIKPEFWRSDDVNAMCIEDRLLFIGLWSYVDDNGVGIDRHADICADLFAHDLSVSPHDTLTRVHDGLKRLATQGVIRRYEVAGKRYIEISGWSKHQKINRPSPGRYPRSDTPDAEIHAPLTESSLSPHESSLPGTGEQGNRGTEEQGREGAAAPAPTRRKPARPIPEDWSPTTSHEEKAQRLGLDVHQVAEEFVNWAISKDERKADWSAAFHNWLTREAKYRQERSSRPQFAPKGQAKEDANLASLAAWVESKNKRQNELPFPGGDPA